MREIAQDWNTFQPSRTLVLAGRARPCRPRNPRTVTSADISLAICPAGHADIPLVQGARAHKLAVVEPGRVSDEQLMRDYGADDVRAFEELYERHRAPLWRFLSRQLRDEAVTADVFQEVWSRVIAHRARYAPLAKFTTWLYHIAHNCCVDHWRRHGRLKRRELAGDDELLGSLADCDAATPEDDAYDAETAARLAAAVARLPDEQRAAFLMYVEGGLGVGEIAAAMEIGDETAKSRLRYAVAKLKRTLADREPESGS